MPFKSLVNNNFTNSSYFKYGGDGGDIGPPPTDEDGVELPPIEPSDNIIAVTNSNWKQVFIN